MADIDNELQIITNAEYGEEVRTAIHDAIFKINQGGGGSEESAFGMHAGIINPSFYEKATVINPIKGFVHVRATSEYEGIIPKPVSDAIKYAPVDVDDYDAFYVRQGRVFPLDHFDNFYKVFLFSVGAVRIESYRDPIYPEGIYSFRIRDVFSSTFNPYMADVPISGYATSTGWYQFEEPVTAVDHAFTNCVEYSGGTQRTTFPVPCNVLYNTELIQCANSDISLISK